MRVEGGKGGNRKNASEWQAPRAFLCVRKLRLDNLLGIWYYNKKSRGHS